MNPRIQQMMGAKKGWTAADDRTRPALEDNLRRSSRNSGRYIRARRMTNLLRRRPSRLIAMRDARQPTDYSSALEEAEVRRRTPRKKKTMGHHPDRNAQARERRAVAAEYQLRRRSRNQHRHEKERTIG